MMATPKTPGLRGTLRHNEPMSRHTTWRVGGPAKQFFSPIDTDDLVVFLSTVPAADPLLWLGLGSNLLVRDGGFPGAVIATHTALSAIERCADGSVRVEAGVPCAKVARFCAAHNLVGVEFLAGIPGTMGGALAMNAGAWGSETWQWVERVETIDRLGARHLRRSEEFVVGYREVKGRPAEWFLAAWLRIPSGDGQAALARIKSLLEKRNATQPMGSANCGSVFRNPEGDYAGRLIEQCGLKGYCIGGACVSEKHANFIINAGAASAADVENLIVHVQKQVLEKTGTWLQPEAHIVGVSAK